MCGFTPQFEGLEKLFQKYESRGFVILGFPCNQFAHQDPENDEGIASFCVKVRGSVIYAHTELRCHVPYHGQV